jgi:regulator of protease activity HflC (stomatin/prohibitin superfamily)
MATEAEASREGNLFYRYQNEAFDLFYFIHMTARAKVVAAEGEQKASVALKNAAEIIKKSPIALQLRYLQTLTTIASEKNSTIVFPIAIDYLNTF